MGKHSLTRISSGDVVFERERGAALSRGGEGEGEGSKKEVCDIFTGRRLDGGTESLRMCCC